MNKDILAYISAVLELIGTGAILFLIGLVILLAYLFTSRKDRDESDDNLKAYEMIKNIKKD